MELPITNNSKLVLEVGVEPEGFSVSLKPGDKCLVRVLEVERPIALSELEVVYESGWILVYAMAPKEVFVNGEREP